jgi:hypothetical protein
MEFSHAHPIDFPPIKVAPKDQQENAPRFSNDANDINNLIHLLMQHG